MAKVGRKTYVDPPPFVPSRFGLFSAAQLVEVGDVHEHNGVKFQPLSCNPAKSYGDSCPLPGDRAKSIDRGVPTRGAEPFTVYGGFSCSPVGFDEADMRERSLAALVNVEQRAVEDVFLTGATDNAVAVLPFLANTGTTDDGVDVTYPTVTTITATPVDPVVGVGLLEEAMGGCYGGVPVLHLPRVLGASLSSNGTVTREGERIVTMLGSRVAFGTGYTGLVAPGGGAAAADVRWLYATGSVVVRRGAPSFAGIGIAETLDRDDNAVVALSERTYSVGFDCCLFAVPVSLNT